MSEGSKQDQRRRILEECKRDEEYNRMKRLKLLEKQRKKSKADPVDKASRKAEEKELIQQLRAERLASKERRRQSDDSYEESKKLPQFTARRRSVDSESSSYDDERNLQEIDGTSYCPHQCVRKSILDEIEKGNSTCATEPLKAQLLEIIGNMSPDSKFREERGHSYKAGQTSKQIAGIIEETSDLVISRDLSPNPNTKRAEISSCNPSSGSPLRLSPTYPVNQPQPIAWACKYEEDSAPSARAVVMTPPTKRTQEISSPERKIKCRVCPVTAPTKQKYRVYDITDASIATDTFEEQQEDSQIAMSITNNTIRLPSTSTAMREERTQEFLNEGWYHNVYSVTNDEFSSVLGSSAHQMNIHPHLQQQYMQNVQTIQSMQKMATSGPIICDRCRYETELLTQHSHPCCPGLAPQTTIQMEQAGKQTAQPTTTIQCDATCPTRNNILRTIYNAFKNPLGRPSYKRPSFDPTVSELYRLNITEGNDYQGHPKRVIFDLIDGEMYRPTMASIGTNTHMGITHSPLVSQMGIVQPGGSGKFLFNPQPPPGQQCTYTDQQSSQNTGAIVANHPQGDQLPKNSRKLPNAKQKLRRYQERIDVYYFDHGNASYYRTTDSPGTIYTELIAERIEHNTAQYWAELFGTIHIAFALFTAFFLQLYRFVLQSTFRPLTVGLVQLTSDYMIKPLLALLFNAIIQPILIYLYNIATSFRDLCEPIADSFGFFLREIAVPIRAFRLVEVRKHKNVRPFAEML